MDLLEEKISLDDYTGFVLMAGLMVGIFDGLGISLENKITNVVELKKYISKTLPR
jgi:hypothetical protein